MTFKDRFNSWQSFIDKHPGLELLNRYPNLIYTVTLSEYFKKCQVSEEKLQSLCRLYTCKQDEVREGLAMLLRDLTPSLNIGQVMQDTAKKYNARHYLFDQYWYKNDVGKGACHALCKYWLKRHVSTRGDSAMPNGFGTAVGKNIKYIAFKQNKASLLRYPLAFSSGPQSVWMLNEENVRKGNDAWIKAVQLMLPYPVGKKNMISFGWATQIDHCVAASCSDGDWYEFFDPNGGIMVFGQGDFAYEKMTDWLEKELPKAKADKYDKILSIDVEEFTPKY